MEENITKISRAWRQNYNQFQRLQICYVSIALVSVVLAGLITLLNQSAGQTILIVTKVSLLTFVMNAVLNSFLPQSGKSKQIKRK